MPQAVRGGGPRSAGGGGEGADPRPAQTLGHLVMDPSLAANQSTDRTIVHEHAKLHQLPTGVGKP